MINLVAAALFRAWKAFLLAGLTSVLLAVILLPGVSDYPLDENWTDFVEGPPDAISENIRVQLLENGIWLGGEPVVLIDEQQALTLGDNEQNNAALGDKATYSLVGTVRRGEDQRAYLVDQDDNFLSVNLGRELRKGDWLEGVAPGSVQIKHDVDNSRVELTLYEAQESDETNE